MWAIGVIAYVVLGGYPPFFAETRNQLFLKIKKANFSFPSKYWGHVSAPAKDFISKLLVSTPAKRLTATGSLAHEWLREDENILKIRDLGPSLKELQKFNSRRKFKATIIAVRLIAVLIIGFL